MVFMNICLPYSKVSIFIFMFRFINIVLLLFVAFACKKADEPITSTISQLSVSPQQVSFPTNGGSTVIAVKMTGSRWTASSSQPWCSVSKQSSSNTSEQVTLTATANNTAFTRTARVLFIMNAKDSVSVEVSQQGLQSLYPDYSNPVTANNTGMSSDAKSIASNMIVGWNLGNSLEVPGDETLWGNPKTSQQLIDAIKAAGINAIRIPCAWDSYIENPTTCKLKASWLARVKEVVDYCYKNNMYVIINIHWDGGWLENNPTYAKQAEVNAKQKALWEQIAVYFRDYDEHLLFAGTNEVHSSTTATAENFEVQMSFNQTFINAVRATGGRNTYRNLVVQAYNTNIDLAVSNLIVPTDVTPNRMLVEVHYYDPWDFCGMEKDESWGTVKYFWGANYAQYGALSSYGQESYVNTQFAKMKTAFVDKGFPVILGEFGASRRSTLTGTALEKHLESRGYFIEYVTQQAKKNGLVPFVWDNGFTGNLGMGIFNRKDGTTFDTPLLQGLLKGAKASNYPF